MRKDLIDEICEAIATHYPFSTSSVKRAYDFYESFDAVIATCDFCATTGQDLHEVRNRLPAAKRETEAKG